MSGTGYSDLRRLSLAQHSYGRRTWVMTSFIDRGTIGGWQMQPTRLLPLHDWDRANLWLYCTVPLPDRPLSWQSAQYIFPCCELWWTSWFSRPNVYFTCFNELRLGCWTAYYHSRQLVTGICPCITGESWWHMAWRERLQVGCLSSLCSLDGSRLGF